MKTPTTCLTDYPTEQCFRHIFVHRPILASKNNRLYSDPCSRK